MYKKVSLILGAALFAVIALPSFVLAHVVVKPAEVGVAKFQTFITGVPNEKDIPTTQLRLVIPEGVKHVSPNVKPGWQIDIKKSGEGETAKVTEITWSGGSIGAGFRDEFAFSAQTPDKETTLQWKAYQTYADGEIVAWDQAPDENKGEDSKPYSQTKIVNDLAKEDTETATPAYDNKSENNKANMAIVFSVIALAVALGSFAIKEKIDASYATQIL